MPSLAIYILLKFMKRFSLLIGFNLLLCILLVAVRYLKTDSILFVFLLKNVFLAYLPLLFLAIRERLLIKGKLLPAKVFAGIGILFLPNSFYIITDLIHLRNRAPVPVWFDTLLIFTCAFAGLVVGFACIKLLMKSVKQHRAVYLAGLYTLMGFGVYLGRFARWNSWDLFQNPMNLISDISGRFITPMDHPRTWIFTFLFGALLFSLDRSIDYIAKMNSIEES